MQINGKQDLFYSLTLTPGSQEYFNLPVPAGTSGIRMVVDSMSVAGSTLAKTDDGYGAANTQGEASGWENLFDQIRIEDSGRDNDVVMDVRYSSGGNNDMAFLTEALMLATPVPVNEYAIRSNVHLDIYTGAMTNCRIFLKARANEGAAGFNGFHDDGSETLNSVTLNFVALMDVPTPAQSIRVYHIGEDSDNNIEYIYPSGNSLRSAVYTAADFGIDDIYSDGKHLTSTPTTLVTDYNVLRNISPDGSASTETGRFSDKAYLTIGNLAGQRIRYEQNSAGKLRVVAIYAEA